MSLNLFVSNLKPARRRCWRAALLKCSRHKRDSRTVLFSLRTALVTMQRHSDHGDIMDSRSCQVNYPPKDNVRVCHLSHLSLISISGDLYKVNKMFRYLFWKGKKASWRALICSSHMVAFHFVTVLTHMRCAESKQLQIQWLWSFVTLTIPEALSSSNGSAALSLRTIPMVL